MGARQIKEGTVRDVLHQLTNVLTTVYDSFEASNIARMVVLFVGKWEPHQLVVHHHESLDVGLLNKLNSYLQELMQGRPVQYVLGEAWFMDRVYKVDERVLIPRPETEELVRWVYEEYESHNKSILDIGTGSGCIAISLAAKLNKTKVSAVDISNEALAVAIINAASNDVKVNFHQHDILIGTGSLPTNEMFDIIVSNPPYVTESDKQKMQKNVLEFEPHMALFVPSDDPLLFYRSIISFAGQRLRASGRLYFEINEALGDEMANLLTISGLTDIVLRKDMHGRHRMISATSK